MEEVSPVVPDIPGVSVEAYKQTLIERFANPTIRDQVTRICSEGSAKLPKWLLPSIVELMDRGGAIDLLCLVVASWILYFQRGRDERGIPLEIIDARAAELTDIARAAGADVRPMLALGWVFGPELSANRIFLVKVQAALNDLIQLGTATCVRNYCDACAR
jgi:mannitol 2-dehydrogenase